MPSGISRYYFPPTAALQRPGLMLRARVWMREVELDAALAGGADPSQSDELELRAKQLSERKKRDELAKEISRVITMGDQQRPAITTPQPPFSPEQVHVNRSLLIELARRLRGYRPVSLQGLALTSLMLEDARGQLAADSSPATLERAIRAALSTLEVGRERREDAPVRVGASA